MKIEIREIKFKSAEYELEIALRKKILRDPLGLKFEQHDLNKEGTDIHLGAFVDGDLRGCLLLTPFSKTTIKMRQVAVDERSQGAGLGRRLVEASEAKARQLGYKEIVLNARDTAVQFYLKLGYEIFGEPFIEVKIPHRAMKKAL